jgi:hypothetical protein
MRARFARIELLSLLPAGAAGCQQKNQPRSSASVPERCISSAARASYVTRESR